MNKVLLFHEDFNISLTVARALGREGVPIDGVYASGSGRCIGIYSRYVGQNFHVNCREDLTADKLNDLVSTTGAKYIIAIDEHDLTHLNSLRNEVDSKVKFLFPEQRVLGRVIDKSITLKYAHELKIHYPRTLRIGTFDDINGALKGISYPVVLKFPRKGSIPRSFPQHLKFRYRYVYNRDELISYFTEIQPYNVFPLIQEYAPGSGLGVELCLHNNEVVGAFQHERIHEFPISGGISVYCRSVPLDPKLFETSVRLLRAMEWEGVAMVEFRKDPRTGRAVLMEVNGRFWGSLPLAVKSGVNFPYILYQTLGEGKPASPLSYKTNVRVQKLSNHCRWLLHAFFIRKNLPPEGFKSRLRVLWEFLSSFDPRVGFDIEDMNDPMPGVYLWAKKLLNFFRFLKN